ncbi:MAG: histidine--tRNA ligase [Salibacteraceae bacterium]
MRRVFRSYGYAPIETPAIEHAETLLGKYGEEGDRLIYRILNNGDFLSKVSDEELLSRDTSALAARISDRALRYDLTVPFARFVVQHRHELSFPFKRFQIQPVWRADRPQKGRYREFFQCDVDVIGSNSPLNEAELLAIISDVFDRLGLSEIQIRINNRKILSGICRSSGLHEQFVEVTIAIDKLDKIGIDGVRAELLNRGLPESGVKKLIDHLSRKGDIDNVLHMISGSLTGEPEVQRGVDEVRKIMRCTPDKTRAKIRLDLSLARGLNYYTGAIIEVVHKNFPSSICGGGRYDDLTGIFGLEGMSGVGVSFGADRIYDLMDDLGLFSNVPGSDVDVLFVNFGDKESRVCIEIADELRKEGFSATLYPDDAKLQKQLKYANSIGARFVMMVGESELQENTIGVKNMLTGQQYKVKRPDLCAFMNENTRA